jgi:1-acyl-sn-glycerol-3-phosphate acyltransferase
VTRLDLAWARRAPARVVREWLLSFVLGPIIDVYVRFRAEGCGHFDALKPPVVFVANHASHLDTPAILRALPRRWRRRTAVAAAADYFYRNRLRAALVALLFNTVPVERRGGGLAKGAKEHLDRLLRQRWNLLLYPEGTRSRDGSVGRLRSGAAVLAAEHGAAIVPVYVAGTHAAMPPGRTWPRRLRGRVFSRRHAVEVRFGPPIQPTGREAVMEQLQVFFREQTRALPPEPSPINLAARQPATGSGT